MIIQDAVLVYAITKEQFNKRTLAVKSGLHEEIPNTASARITGWSLAPMGFDCELKYTPGEQMLHADALSRMDFNEDESGNDRVCFAINNIYFTLSDLVTQAEIISKHGPNRFFQGKNESKPTCGKNVQKRKNDSNNEKMH